MEEHTVLVRDYVLTVVAMTVGYNLVIEVAAHHAIRERAQVFHAFLVHHNVPHAEMAGSQS